MKKQNGQERQRTPKDHEIPVPKRGDFFDNLKKVAEKPPKKSRRGKRRKKK